MKDNIIIGVIGGIIAGLAVLFVQFIIDYFKTKKQKKKDRKVGNKELKILDKNFIINHLPHKISIEKIIEDFGQPFKKQVDDAKELVLYQYNFLNAKFLISKSIETNEVISTTLFSCGDKKNPILCHLSYEEENIEFGDAVISDIIIRDNITFENINNIFENNCIIKSKYAFKPIKYLTFCYEIGDNFEKLEETKNKKIKQICITQNENIVPMLPHSETFYN